MDPIRFIWDDRKEAVNRRKHGVSFDEARSVFLDENAKLIDDPDHSRTESRFLLPGVSYKLRLLVVSHNYRRNDEEIRIISARKAHAHERKAYLE